MHLEEKQLFLKNVFVPFKIYSIIILFYQFGNFISLLTNILKKTLIIKFQKHMYLSPICHHAHVQDIHFLSLNKIWDNLGKTFDLPEEFFITLM